MRMLEALKSRAIFLLWSGQFLSCIGDEVYGVALIWFATQLIGFDAGYIAAIQAASIFLFSIVAGAFVDHRDHRKVMIAADVARGVALLSLPIYALFQPLNLWILIPVAVVVSALSAVFHPAMTAMLPVLVEERSLLQTTNGLMESTIRLARVVGPGSMAVIGGFVPLIHYFTLDAISFFASAWSIAKISPRPALASTNFVTVKKDLLSSFRKGYQLLERNTAIKFQMYSGALVAAAWMLVFPLALTLLVRERLDSEVASLGMVVCAYGLGNLAAIFLMSNTIFTRPDRLMSVGRIIGGIGFILLAFSHNLAWIMITCAIAAAGGPVADIGRASLIQDFFAGTEIAQIHRFRMAISQGVFLLSLLASPALFRDYSVPTVIFACGLVILLSGLYGHLNYPRPPASYNRPRP